MSLRAVISRASQAPKAQERHKAIHDKVDEEIGSCVANPHEVFQQTANPQQT